MSRWLLAALLPLVLAGQSSKKYEIQQPKGKWQTPGEIQQPKGKWQVPKGLQAIKVQEAKCEQRMVIGAEALFAFNQAALNPDAQVTLRVLGPMLQKHDGKPITIEGHTDAFGGDAFNQKLSERRAATVFEWLLANKFVTAGKVRTVGFGRKKPLVSNTKPDGSDDAEGRKKNRRVEIIVNTCE